MTPCFHEIASPLASCRIASTTGVRPLKMTSFRLIQIAHNVANMRFHSAALRYGPSPIDRQKSSNDVNSGWATPTNRQTAWEMGHSTKRCSQFSRLAPHNTQSPAESGAMRCRKDLVISRCRRRSHTKIRIFTGVRLFHTRRQRRKKSGSSDISVSVGQ